MSATTSSTPDPKHVQQQVRDHLMLNFTDMNV